MKKYLARRKNNDPIHKIIPMEIYIRYNSAPDWYKDFLFDDDKQIAQDNINTLKSIYDNNNLGVIYC